MNETKCKDTMGNPLAVGQWIDILPPPGVKWVGRITEISEGGIALSIDKNNKGITPAKVRLVLDITLQANPQMPIFPNVVRIVTPMESQAADNILNKISDEGLTKN